MKQLVLLSLLAFGLFSCKEKSEDDISKLKHLNHAELGFELPEPNIILNEMAKGEVKRNIYSVLQQSYWNSNLSNENYWGFEYVENSDRVSQMTFYKPHYSGCEQDKFKFYYNSKNFIDSVVSKRVNCGGFTVNKKYTFNYNKKGLLKSIFMDNPFFLEVNYIGYYPNGKLKEIYNSHYGRGDTPHFGHQTFYYDESYTNVIRVTNIHKSVNSSYSYNYSHDNTKNPFKSFFIAVSVLRPALGFGAFLSENNVIKLTEKNELNIHGVSSNYDCVFDFTNNGKLNNYKQLSVNAGDYVFYKIN